MPESPAGDARNTPPSRPRQRATHLGSRYGHDCVLAVCALLLCVCAPVLVASRHMEGHLNQSVLLVICCVVYMELKQHLILCAQ
jgi:hypothetical protein